MLTSELRSSVNIFIGHKFQQNTHVLLGKCLMTAVEYKLAVTLATLRSGKMIDLG